MGNGAEYRPEVVASSGLPAPWRDERGSGANPRALSPAGPFARSSRRPAPPPPRLGEGWGCRGGGGSANGFELRRRGVTPRSFLAERGEFHRAPEGLAPCGLSVHLSPAVWGRGRREPRGTSGEVGGGEGLPAKPGSRRVVWREGGRLQC